MKETHILEYLHGSLATLERATFYYLEYLNTGDINNWKKVVLPRGFFIYNFAKWHDENKYPEKTNLFGKWCDTHELLTKTTYNPKKRYQFAEKDLMYFSYFKEEITKLFLEEASRVNWSHLNLKEEELLAFIERVKKLNLLDTSLRAA